ncbi:hypothetical protein [Roseivirga thermotolerans]|uniref:Uncharacterized protein n=1 Tax=Roseivirga thermotolerans TaxID=1758176 RepID=A0ABQ3I8A9_9BACT|nr:hypothetical protein [Roseivirga thermotolerans]GHE67337.1 hypothetical protein GCM10011340_23550 [Roseivirga thermotolerans]
MKNLIRAIMALAVTSLTLTSCGDDEDDAVAIAISAPAEITLGAGFQQTLAIDATGSGLASATVTISKEGTNVLTDELTLSGDEADLDFSFTINETGDYTAVVTVTDGSGATQSANIALTIACMPTPDHVVASKISFVAEVPSFTTGSVGVVGQFTDWGNNPDVSLTKVGESDCYCGTVETTIADGGFKLRLDGTWDKVEKTSDCQEILNGENRTTTAVAGDTVAVVVAEWRNSDQFGGGCGN